MKCLLIVLGESFREGSHNSRSSDTECSYKCQLECIDSHIEFIKHIEQLNYSVDIAINTYKTKYKNLLLNMYPNIVYNNFTNEDYGYSKNVFHKSLQHILPNINLNIYEFIFIIRFDLILKKYLFDIFNPKWSSIMYPYVMYIEYEDTPFIFPVVSDIFCFIPKKYFNQLINISYKLCHHHCWRDLIKTNNLSFDDLDVMIDTIHDPNTSVDLNPLYKINGRSESKIYKYPNKKYIKLNQTIIEQI